ncbi:MAG: PKD domain-containing protein [Ferruginibacter sp.]
MRKFGFQISIYLSFLFSNVSAQTFSNNIVTSIPDINEVLEIPVTVNGLPSAINSAFGLSNICLNLSHPYIGELTIVLKSPDGMDSVKLLWHDGGNTAINSAICITEAGDEFIATYPTIGTSSYFGEEDNNEMNNGRNPNGIWRLRITDVIPNNAGTINSVSISFENNPPVSHSRIFGCSLSTPWGCKCPDGSIDCDLLPDMINSKLALDDNYEQANEIRFSVATPNIGAGPLEMKGSNTECFCDATPVPCGTICPAGQELKHNVYQTIYHRAGNTMTISTRLAGQMEFHPTHNHIHVDHWTNNSLRIKTADPNPTHWPIIGSSNKISFCLVNLGNCDSYPGYCIDQSGNTVHNADVANLNFGVFTGCGLEQGIYPGNVDIYNAIQEGQSIPVGGLCNGSYYLVSITDPDNSVLESNHSNNWSYTRIHIVQQPGNCCRAGFYADTLHGIDSLIVHFIDSSIAIPNQWHWDFGDGFNSTEQFPTHTYLHPGNYSVTLSTESETGCKDSITKTNYISVQSSSPITGISVTSSPNPFTDHLVLGFVMPEELMTSISVYDAIGRKLHSEKAVVPKGISSIILPFYKISLSKGLYFIKINAKDYSKVCKMIKR